MNTEDRFEQLKRRFEPAIRVLESQGAAIQMMNIQDGRLMVRAVVKSAAERDRVLDAFRGVDPSLDQVHPDLRLENDENVPSTGQSTVQSSQNFSREGELPS